MIETAKDYLELEARHATGAYHPRGITLVRGEGARVWDDTGRSYIDCTAAYGICSLGHSHPAVVEAVRAQAGTLIGCNSSFANDQRALFLEELSAVLPHGMERVFLCNSGTEAIEAALKFARLTTQRPGVVAAMRGFHGRTLGALSATWDAHYREPFAPLVPGFQHVPFNNVEALEEAVTESVGAVLLEVVQGEGGVRPASAAYLERAEALCRERGALLIVDEVQTGFGRTGRLFGVEHFNLEPDLLCMAKGIAGGFPMGAVALSGRVARLPVGAHGSTFGGNPLACAAARATLRVILEENLASQAAGKGRRLLERLRNLESRRVREVRGLGLMIGIELRERVAPFLGELQRRGVLALSAGPTVMRLLPPLVISQEELEQAADEIAAVLASEKLT
ncbi:MAG TPA: aspartate aminotransferase family protein [Pyrinomonadaceae bacterium]|nr:aspartate aminotransferase family protein [Pyrinomonadaceae bacterium]